MIPLSNYTNVPLSIASIIYTHDLCTEVNIIVYDTVSACTTYYLHFLHSLSGRGNKRNTIIRFLLLLLFLCLNHSIFTSFTFCRYNIGGSPVQYIMYICTSPYYTVVGSIYIESRSRFLAIQCS